MDNPALIQLREKARQLPLLPGVYIMKDKNGKIIYVGKAKALKNRVSSYFTGVERHTEKVYKTVENIRDFEYIVTDSEFEALVLECSLIKLHNPKYNILLKDDKGYSYIKVAPTQWGKISAVKQRLEDGAQYFGPYTSSFVVSQTVDEANKAFRLPTCHRKFPQELHKGRPCLNFHIKQCMGVCRGRISLAEYNETLGEAIDFIKGGSSKTIRNLTSRMNEYAEQMEFEKAAHLRDRIRAIERIAEQQKVVFTSVPEQDIVALVQDTKDTCAVVLKFRGERLVDKQDFLLGSTGEIAAARREFLLRYYASSQEIPKQITLDAPCEDQELIERMMSEQAGCRVTLHVPERGDRLKLVEMARTNAAQRLSMKIERTGKEVAALDELARLLGLPTPPAYIEAYDISNIGSDTVVGGMAVFEDGRPLKSAYRKFTIKTVVSTDDYACMREVIARRFARYEEEKASGEGFGRLPDLILLDGGKGHVSAVKPLMNQLGLSVPLFGMVKDDKHRTRAVAVSGGEIAINSCRSAFTLVSAIQDEVHRYSINFSRSKHQKKGFALMLTEVPGIGETRATALYRHFKTLTAIREASVEQLAMVKGMNLPAAQKLYNYLYEQEKNVDSPTEKDKIE